MIAVVDYGVGNLGSVVNMFRKVNAEAVITSTEEGIAKADKLVLPGVGAFDRAMDHLERSGLIPILQQKVRVEGTSILGICLGMQLLAQRSEEGSAPGLGWIDADVVRFNFEGERPLKVPHMGWNTLSIRRQNRFWKDGDAESRYYFVHSYHVRCHNAEDVAATAQYGTDFTAAIVRDNIVGVQFHPEKSHKFGMQFLSTFASTF